MNPLTNLVLLHMDGYSEGNSRSLQQKDVSFAIFLEQNSEAWNRVAAQRKDETQRGDAPLANVVKTYWLRLEG